MKVLNRYQDPPRRRDPYHLQNLSVFRVWPMREGEDGEMRVRAARRMGLMSNLKIETLRDDSLNEHDRAHRVAMAGDEEENEKVPKEGSGGRPWFRL